MTASGTRDEKPPPIVTHDHQAELPSAASGARWGRSFHSLERMSKVSVSYRATIGCFGIATWCLLTAANAAASSRQDVASTYLVCSSLGEPLAELRRAFGPAGVIFEKVDAATIRVGYARWWFSARWLCQLSVSPAGLVISSERLP